MEIEKSIHRLRTQAKMTQAQFSETFGVSQQSVQKWESGAAKPDVDKLVMIAKYFDVSLDALIMGNDSRIVEEMDKASLLKPQYGSISDSEFYPSNLMTEYTQSVEEGLDVEAYKDIFSSVSRLPKGEIKKKLGDVLFEVVLSAKQREDYPYVEPSELEQIQCLRRGTDAPLAYDASTLEDRLTGAWLGRICGCMLGKTVEGIRTNELIPFLKESGNYPMHRYIYRSDLGADVAEKYKFNLTGRQYADGIDGMPVDDDTNYMVLSQMLIERYGYGFTPHDVAKTWLSTQSKDSYWTAERVAYCNFIKGYLPPQSAIYKNPYREWIGAQIRGDYFGYINPGNPKLAAEMAWRDASISHIKNGIYGEMFASAMIAVAATTSDIKSILLGGLNEIPATSRLYEEVANVIDAYEGGTSQKDCFRMIHEKYDEHSTHGWCHTISNAMIVAASLLYGEGDYARSICMAVETGFDTDCNGATVGSVLGMAYGASVVDEYWTKPINNKLHTSIFGVGTVNIDECIKKTLKHAMREA